MGKVNKKHEILNTALSLFSTQGYEGTSISQIAESVGICKASFYSHFESKKAVLDDVINNVLQDYEKKSVFSKSKNENDEYFYPQNCDETIKLVKSQITYILHDDKISKVRKMLNIEQFRNAELASLQTKHTYSDVMQYFSGLINTLKENGILSGGDTKIMVAQFCLPITVWVSLCDRESNRETEVMELIEKHIRQFFEIYGREKKEN